MQGKPRRLRRGGCHAVTTPPQQFHIDTLGLTAIYPIEWLRDTFLDGCDSDLLSPTKCEPDSPLDIGWLAREWRARGFHNRISAPQGVYPWHTATEFRQCPLGASPCSDEEPKRRLRTAEFGRIGLVDDASSGWLIARREPIMKILHLGLRIRRRLHRRRWRRRKGLSGSFSMDEGVSRRRVLIGFWGTLLGVLAGIRTDYEGNTGLKWRVQFIIIGSRLSIRTSQIRL
jgi:hypothetical protein